MKIKRLDHLVITTNNLEKCLYFYVDVLGMQLENRDNRYAVKFGNQKINIHTKKAQFLPSARNITFGSADICLIAEGYIDSVYDEIREKGIQIELGIVERTGAMGKIKSIYLRDPDENLIEISTYL